jgi:prepilin signal peptidase PulO-like enzyme (type II secretory pathway)
VELATGSAFFLILTFQPQILYFLIVPFLIVIFVYDLKHYLIPDKIIYLGIVIALAFTIFNLSSVLNYLLAGLGAAAFFFSVVLLSRGKWMGVGDIKLALFMGLILGFPGILVALFLAFFTGAIIGIGLIVCRGKSLKSEVPFGPFLVGGTFVAIFLGKTIADWYFQYFILM